MAVPPLGPGEGTGVLAAALALGLGAGTGDCPGVPDPPGGAGAPGPPAGGLLPLLLVQAPLMRDPGVLPGVVLVLGAGQVGGRFPELRCLRWCLYPSRPVLLFLSPVFFTCRPVLRFQELVFLLRPLEMDFRQLLPQADPEGCPCPGILWDIVETA
ncbi:uncharacterized protein LOC130295377 isoform X2 [Hyla sarda]|uniref:uncharacterized protein LOC130295377 isoform X2 n=1 Tax=Hyla sarda TaxID=327740 RepID=UPI0024C336B7|nr:uncharacterized protein LOC130295377 isoform X2 [Hyla sarda]